MGLFSNTTSSKIAKIEKRLSVLEKENKMLKTALSEVNQNMVAVDGMIKIMMAAQQQVSIDVATIYDALHHIIGTAQ